MVLMAGILRWLKLEWWMASGRVDYKRGRYQAALQSFEQLVALYPQHLLAQSYVGACYMSLKQYDDAVLAFERGLQIKSDSAYCHAELGRASTYLSKDRDAIEYLNRALRISPKYEQKGTYVLALASAYAGMGDYERSSKYYADAVRLLPANADAQYGLGWVLRISGKCRDAEAPLRKAIALEPDDAAKHNELAVALFDMERWAEAEQEFRSAIRLNPDNPNQHHWLGVALRNQERFSEGVGEYREAIRLNPEHYESYWDLGIALTLLEDYEGSIKAYEAALRLDPSPSFQLLMSLAVNCAQCKRWDQLVQTTEQIVRLFPEEQEGYSHLAYAYMELDRDCEAIEACKVALRIQPDFFPTVANLGISYLKLGMLSESVSAFKRAIELNPGNAEVRLKLGETYAKQGDLPEAREQLRVLEEADPDAAKELCSIVAAASSENPLTLEP
jgi:tetratricopeptide (TPR) repeat protein